jgi:calmodulin
LPSRPSPDPTPSPPPFQDKGGVLVTQADVDIAFKFLDAAGTGRLGLSALSSRLRAFFPETASPADAGALLGDDKALTKSLISDLLMDNTVTHFDPVAEAFKAFDPADTGALDPAALAPLFARLGLPAVTPEDADILAGAAAGAAVRRAQAHTHAHGLTPHHGHEEAGGGGHGNDGGGGAGGGGGGGRRGGDGHPRVTLEDFRLLLNKTRERPPTDEELGRRRDD